MISSPCKQSPSKPSRGAARVSAIRPTRYGVPARSIKFRGGNLRAALAALVLLAAVLLGAASPAAAASGDATTRILALGDSLVAGFGLPKSEGFIAQLQRALDEAGLDVQVLDGGYSGDTTAGGLARLDWALEDEPDLVILELGANDGLRGIEPAATRRNLDAMLTRLDRAGVPVVLAGMLAPPNLGPEYGAEFNRIYPELAAEHEVTLYPFFLDGVAAEPALNQEDGIHPNAEGVAVIVERLMPVLLQALESLGGSGAAG